MEIIIKDKEHTPPWRPGQDLGHFTSLDKKHPENIDALLSPEEQYSPEEMRRITAAAHHTNEKMKDSHKSDHITAEDGVKRIIT